MAFWNRKKKRTTAKPKINASVPKPKVNSEKQESSIPPQPKKMGIPKPDKLPKNENVRKEFLKAFHQLTYRHRPLGCMAGFYHNVCMFFIESGG